MSDTYGVATEGSSPRSTSTKRVVGGADTSVNTVDGNTGAISTGLKAADKLHMRITGNNVSLGQLALNNAVGINSIQYDVISLLDAY